MKIAFQNFLTTLKRYRTASILNIAGLTLAFFAMYVIMTQVFFYVRYNQCIEDNNRVYMLGELSPTNHISDLVGRPLVEQAIAQSPAVEVGGMILCPMYDPATHFFWVRRSTGEITKFRSSYVKNISLPMLDYYTPRCDCRRQEGVGSPQHRHRKPKRGEASGRRTG